MAGAAVRDGGWGRLESEGVKAHTVCESTPEFRSVTAHTVLRVTEMSSKPWYHKGLRFSCTQCGNCCKNHGEYAYVYLTEHELEAIPAHLGLSRAEFLKRYCAPKDEEGWISLRMDQPACPFLDPENRCQIYPVRPKQCATWPFWEENLERERWEGAVSERCPGIGSGPLVAASEVERIARETEEWYGGDGDEEEAAEDVDE